MPDAVTVADAANADGAATSREVTAPSGREEERT